MCAIRTCGRRLNGRPARFPSGRDAQLRLGARSSPASARQSGSTVVLLRRGGQILLLARGEAGARSRDGRRYRVSSEPGARSATTAATPPAGEAGAASCLRRFAGADDQTAGDLGDGGDAGVRWRETSGGCGEGVRLVRRPPLSFIRRRTAEGAQGIPPMYRKAAARGDSWAFIDGPRAPATLTREGAGETARAPARPARVALPTSTLFTRRPARGQGSGSPRAGSE